MQLRENASKKKGPDWISILVRYRWAIAVVYVILVLLFEYIQYSHQGFITFFSPILWIKLFFLVLLLPVVFLITSNILNKKSFLF